MMNDGMKIGGPGGLSNIGKSSTPSNITPKVEKEQTAPNVFGTGEAIEVSSEALRKQETKTGQESPIETTSTAAPHKERDAVPAFLSLEEVRIGDNLLQKKTVISTVGFGPNNMPTNKEGLYTGLMNSL